MGGCDLVKMDLAGKSDPFVKVVANKQTYTTKKIDKNLNPCWNENTQFVFFDKVDCVRFEVYDWDKGSQHDAMGTATIDLNSRPSFYNDDYKANGFEGKLDVILKNKKKGQLEVKVNGKTIRPLEIEEKCKDLRAECAKLDEECAMKQEACDELKKTCQQLLYQKDQSIKEQVGYEEELETIKSKCKGEEERIYGYQQEIAGYKKEIAGYKEKKVVYQKKKEKYAADIERENGCLEQEEEAYEKNTEEVEILKERVDKYQQNKGYKPSYS